MEVRFFIDDRLIEALQERTNIPRASDLGRDAFNLLDWATQERARGAVIAATGPSGDAVSVPFIGAVQAAHYQAER
jgi:hypothetical protein